LININNYNIYYSQFFVYVESEEEVEKKISVKRLKIPNKKFLESAAESTMSEGEDNDTITKVFNIQ